MDPEELSVTVEEGDVGSVTYSQGSYQVTFSDTGNSITFSDRAAQDLNHETDDWHYYEVEATISRETLDFLGQVNGVDITAQDVELAIMQHAAPEWSDVIGLGASIAASIPTAGSTTNTFGPGDVFHVIGRNGSVVGNVTNGFHPFSPGVVAKSGYVLGNGDVVVQTIGVAQ